MADRQKPHVLIVRDVGEPYGPLSTHEFEDYEVIHHDDCPTEEHVGSDDGDRWTEYACDVGCQLNEGELRWTLKYSGTPVTEPGEYLIECWFETIRGFDYTEYDGGIALVLDDEGKPVRPSQYAACPACGGVGEQGVRECDCDIEGKIEQAEAGLDPSNLRRRAPSHNAAGAEA